VVARYVGPAGRGHNYAVPVIDVPGDGRCEGPPPAPLAEAHPSGRALVLVDDAAEDIVAADRPKKGRP
jgi:hypothetical protein